MNEEKEIKSVPVASHNFTLSINGKIFGKELETIISNGSLNVFYKGVFECYSPEVGLKNNGNYLDRGIYELNMVNQENEVLLSLGSYETKGSRIISTFEENDNLVLIEVVFTKWQ